MKNIGTALRRARLLLGWSATEAAKRFTITPQYLSRIEKGVQVPSDSLLERMIQFYQIPPVEAELLRRTAGHTDQPAALATSPTARIEPARADAGSPQIQIDPLKTPVLYTNAMFVSSDDFGIVIDAGQKVGPTNGIQVVSRMGLSLQHAVKLREALESHIKLLREKGLED